MLRWTDREAAVSDEYLRRTLLAVVVCREVSRQSFAGEVVPYQFPILEMGLFILVLFGLEFLLSAWTVSRQRKQSLVDQMRAAE